jgi:hypothetical protein
MTPAARQACLDPDGILADGSTLDRGWDAHSAQVLKAANRAAGFLVR